MSRPKIYYCCNSSKFICRCDYASVFEHMHPAEKIFFKMFRGFSCYLFLITDFWRDVSSASYCRIHNQHHLGTDHLIHHTHPLFPDLLLYDLRDWAPMTRKYQDYRFHLVRAGIHSLVLVNFSFHMRSHCSGYCWWSKKGYPKLVKVEELGTGPYQK